MPDDRRACVSADKYNLLFSMIILFLSALIQEMLFSNLRVTK